MCTKLRLKVFGLGNKTHTLRVLQPKTRGTYWNEEGVDVILHEVAEDLERRFPTEEFRLVVIGTYAFNFVHAGPLPPEEIAAKLEAIAPVSLLSMTEPQKIRRPGLAHEDKQNGAPEVGVQGRE